ncbi:DUF2487 family protein [Paenibacillus sp. CMAA1364]
MKFTDISADTWLELQPYLDTCLIPFTGLKGSESPIEATTALERLRDLLDIVESRYNGRIVTYPAFHYGHHDHCELLNEICHKVKKSGFKYVMVMTADTYLETPQCTHADLILSQPYLQEELVDSNLSLSTIIQERVEKLWKRNDLS